MTSEEGDLLLTQSYSPYGGELEEIGGEPATFGYAGQLYDEQTGLLFLRARYYSPSTGRFISHDSWAGDAYMPMSYNKWLYGYGNPIRYTDPSGENPLAIIGGILAGTAAGAIGGKIIGECSYDLAMAGQCGCELKQKAFSMTRQQWVTNAVFGGAIIGVLGVAGVALGEAVVLPSFVALAAYALEIMIGGGVFIISGIEAFNTFDTIVNEVGLTWCTAPRMAFAILGMIGGGQMMKHGWNGVVSLTSAEASVGTTATSKIWTSRDKYVGPTATAIDQRYPGKVKEVNRIVYRPDGTPVTDLDIVLDDMIIQVKSGGGKSATGQAIRTEAWTKANDIPPKEVVYYLPEQTPRAHVVRGLKKLGFEVFTNLTDLLNYIK